MREKIDTRSNLVDCATIIRREGDGADTGGGHLPVEIVTMADFPPAPDVEETGETFMENAHLKAAAAVARTGLISIATMAGWRSMRWRALRESSRIVFWAKIPPFPKRWPAFWNCFRIRRKRRGPAASSAPL